MIIEYDDIQITPEYCFRKASEALGRLQSQVAREWRRLGETIFDCQSTSGQDPDYILHGK